MTITRRSAGWIVMAGALLGLVFGFLTVVLNLPGVAGSTTVPVAGDAYTRFSSPKTNYGANTRWSLDGRWDAWRYGFLKFHLPPAAEGTTYTQVTLRLFSDNAPPEGNGPVVYRTGNDWLETTLTWANQPYRARRLASDGEHTDQGWMDFDVTSTVPGPGTTVSFRLETTDRAWLGFESKEKDGGHGAELVVETLTKADAPVPPPVAGTTTAADTWGWGKPVAGDEFGYLGPPDPAKWNVYHSAGHAGNGLRRPSAWKVDGTVARVTGDPQGTSGGMSANFGRRKYGRWETRMRTNARDPEYHPVLILWPDSGEWPCDGEIDYAEGSTDVTKIGVFHHYSCANRQTSATRTVDTTQWHNYAVEWSPRAIIGYIDGEEWFRDVNPRHQPPGPMHQTAQLDWFPDGTTTSTSWMEVDWVRVYDLKPSPISPATSSPTPSPTAPASSGGDIKLAVLGDINHEGNSSTTSREGEIASSIAAWNPTALALTGDFQYETGDCAALVGNFDKTGMGALMPRVIATAGPTHDYTSSASSAADYSRHMEGTCPGQISGASLSARSWRRTIQPYEPHFVDLGEWTVVSMPSAQWRDGYSFAFGATWSGSELTSWLDSTVAAATARGDGIVVIEHEPYWSSGTSEHPDSEGDQQRSWIDVLDKYDVPLLLAGHQHNYERFHPQNADGVRNDATGTQQFQVSTGGIGLRSFTTSAANSATRNSETYGWLKLVLHADGSYDWQFEPTDGSFTDTGSRSAR